MKKFKKAALTAASYVSVAALAIGGTLAYYTSQDNKVNPFVVAEGVKIELNEQERVVDENGFTTELQDFVPGKELKPAIIEEYNSKHEIDVNGNKIGIRDKVNNYVDKIISVTNTGNNDAYVRTIMAVPEAGDFDTTYNASEQWLHWNGSAADDFDGNGWIWGADKATEWPGNTNNWDVVENVEIDGAKYDIYVATHNTAIAGGESTAPTLLGLYLDSAVNCEIGDDGSLNYTFETTDKTYNLGDISRLDILVCTQGVSTDVADNAWDALDKAFGDVDAANAKKWFEADDTVVAKPEPGAVRPTGIIPDINGDVISHVIVEDGSDDSTNFRAIYNGERGSDYVTGDVFIIDSKLDGTYAMNLYAVDGSGAKLFVENTDLLGWVSYTGFAEASFTDCTFNKNSSPEIYKTIRPYDTTVFTNCNFAEGYEFWLDKLGAEDALTFENCTIGGVAIDSIDDLNIKQVEAADVADAVIIK